jgi:hypothetical protein
VAHSHAPATAATANGAPAPAGLLIPGAMSAGAARPVPAQQVAHGHCRRAATRRAKTKQALISRVGGKDAGGNPPASAGCDRPGHRDFDFWVGDWTVTEPLKGQPLGENRVERILGGCVLREQWTGSNGPVGESPSAYDESRHAGARVGWSKPASRCSWREGCGQAPGRRKDATRLVVANASAGNRRPTGA